MTTQMHEMSSHPTAVARAVVIVEAQLVATPPWPTGPYPVANEVVQATADRRETYYVPRAARSLWGAPDEPRRWHREPRADETLTGLPVLGVEFLQLPVFVDPLKAVVAIHVDLGNDPLASLVGVRCTNDGGFPDGSAIDDITDGACTGIAGSVRNTTLTFVAFRDGVPEGPYGPSIPWADTEQWLRVLATATPPSMYTPDPTMPPPEVSLLSNTWRALVMRDGMAFLALDVAALSDPHIAKGFAELYVRSIYADAIILGRMQRLALDELAQQLSAQKIGKPEASNLRKLETRLDEFRQTLWWQHISGHESVNVFLRQYHKQHNMPELLGQIVSDLNDSARLQGVIEGERSARSLDLITKVGFPAGAVLGAAPIWIEFGWAKALLATAIAAAAGGTFYWIEKLVRSGTKR